MSLLINQIVPYLSDRLIEKLEKIKNKNIKLSFKSIIVLFKIFDVMQNIRYIYKEKDIYFNLE